MTKEIAKSEQAMPATQTQAVGGMIAIAQQREIAEVQAKLLIARSAPRDPVVAKQRIINACADPDLAAEALYTYARGGTDITGESIRLAEVMAQNWCNFEFGVRELERDDEESTAEAYAWDLETNVAQRKTFKVPHIRYSRSKGNTKLSDPRDIYENIANNGARRMRACILGMMPTDVKKAAVKTCEATLAAKVKITPAFLSDMEAKFAEIGVSKALIEKRIQRKLDAITAGHVIQLTKIYNSIKDGMSAPAEWFEMNVKAQPKEADKGSLDLSDLGPKTEESQAPEEAPHPAEAESQPEPEQAQAPLKTISRLQIDKMYMIARDRGYTDKEMLTVIAKAGYKVDFNNKTSDIPDGAIYKAILKNFENPG